MTGAADAVTASVRIVGIADLTLGNAAQEAPAHTGELGCVSPERG
ncbi:hypothetical protein [Candidatus Poriferisodalis sp.]